MYIYMQASTQYTGESNQQVAIGYRIDQGESRIMCNQTSVCVVLSSQVLYNYIIYNIGYECFELF